MSCAPFRDAISALLDGEDPGLDEAALRAHLQACGACSSWSDALGGLHRAVRVREADPVPDLSERILGRAAPPRRLGTALGEPVSVARWALFAVALTQLVLAAPSLLGIGSDPVVHATRELGSFDVALAVGLLVAAWQPERAWGLLPVVAALGLVMGGTAVLDVVRGNTTSLGEAHHLLDLAGVVLLWWVARDVRPLARTRRLARP